MIPKIIHQIWLGDQMPGNFFDWTKSVTEKNPDWLHRLWNKEALEEEGFQIEAMKEELEHWAGVSNAIRIILLNRYGGVYLDTDVECLKSLDELPRTGAFASLQDADRICNAVMGCEAKHPWVRWQVRNFARYDHRDPASGVYLASEAPRDGLTLVPTHLVYPFSYDTPIEKRIVHPDSILVHYWAGSWGSKSSTS